MLWDVAPAQPLFMAGQMCGMLPARLRAAVKLDAVEIVRPDADAELVEPALSSSVRLSSTAVGLSSRCSYGGALNSLAFEQP